MTNFEYYKDKIQQFVDKPIHIGLLNGEPINCNKIKCNECNLNGKCWQNGFIKWLYQEYKPYVDWNKVKVDTPILVSNDGENWHRRYFAKYENDKIYVFQAGATSWSNKSHPTSWKCIKLNEEEK